MPQLDDCYCKAASIVSREIAGEMILVPIRQNVGDLESIFTLNDTAGYAWSLLDGQSTLGEIRDQMVFEFEVDAAQAGKDLLDLVAQLESFGAVSKG